MTDSVKCIMLVDDNKIDNFFHERVIKKCGAAEAIAIHQSACGALQHIKDGNVPEIIFLDINMPGMSGWEFIEEYKKLAPARKCLIIPMISNYDDPDDDALEAMEGMFYDFRPKPITKEMLQEVLQKFYAAP